MLFAYFGPETILPLTSVLAAVAGVFVIFGRLAVRVPLMLCRRLIAIVKGQGTIRGPVARKSAGKVRTDSPTPSRPVQAPRSNRVNS